MVPIRNKWKPMLLSKYAMCDSKTPRFIKKQEASGLFSNLRLIIPSGIT